MSSFQKVSSSVCKTSSCPLPRAESSIHFGSDDVNSYRLCCDEAISEITY